VRRLLRWYGGSAWHFLALATGAALSAYAVSRVPTLDDLVAIGLWFGGTLVLHDLVLFPAYLLMDDLGGWLSRRGGAPGVPWRNHLRFPALLSGLLLLAWFPLVLRLSTRYQPATGRSTDPFLGRWLAVTAVLFALSAAAYVVRLGVRRRRAE
jgi:hypothetical protein